MINKDCPDGDTFKKREVEKIKQDISRVQKLHLIVNQGVRSLLESDLIQICHE